MGNIARHHHYLPQCYLRGFLTSGQKRKITVIDKKDKKFFETNIRNIGGVRDFNRIKLDGILPDSLENNLSSFEGQVATALREIEKEHSIENETIYTTIINLIALIAIRNPHMRCNWNDSQDKLLKKILALSLDTKERWESILQRRNKNGVEINEDVSYDKMKEFVERGEYKIVETTESHIVREFSGINVILPLLFSRGWTLAIASEESGNYITCDNPVCLYWKKPDSIPPLYRNNPGFGMPETIVIFPVSKKMSIIGEFGSKNQKIIKNKKFVSAMNSMILYHGVSQVYAPDLSFFFIDIHNRIREGKDIFT